MGGSPTRVNTSGSVVESPTAIRPKEKKRKHSLGTNQRYINMRTIRPPDCKCGDKTNCDAVRDNWEYRESITRYIQAMYTGTEGNGAKERVDSFYIKHIKKGNWR